MALLELVNELLLQIISYLPREQDLNCLIRSNRQLYSLFNTYLYAQNIKHHRSRALLRASEHGCEATLHLFLDLGADINVKSTPDYPLQWRYHFDGLEWKIPVNALWIACITGQARSARVLLEAGISDNDYAQKRESMPLYYALGQGHDDVALVLLDHFSDITVPISWTRSRSTPLELASHLGLPSLVRYLLEKGADVHVEDGDGMTALHYAVLHPATCRQCFDVAMVGMGNEVTFLSRGNGYEADAEVVRLLLERGAKLDQKKAQHGTWSHRHSARQLARNHPNEDVRKLCGADGGWASRFMLWK